MTKANIRESVQARVGVDWLAKHGIEDSVIDDIIVDEYHKLIADTGLLEGEYTTTTDGTNPYVEIPESVVLVKRLHYDYTAGSDWGDLLEEVSPLEADGDIESGTPEFYWVQGMNRVGYSRLYFDKLPSSGVTIRALFLKWPDEISSDTSDLEIKRAWAKVIKHIVTANVCLLGAGNDKMALHRFEMTQYYDSLRVANSVSNTTPYGTTSKYRDYY